MIRRGPPRVSPHIPPMVRRLHCRHNTTMKSKITLLFALSSALAAGGLAGGCAATRTSDSTGQYVDDSTITTKVKTALFSDDRVKSFEINVKTNKQTVQLSGFVDTSDQKAQAARDAAGVAGVMNVENDLLVK